MPSFPHDLPAVGPLGIGAPSPAEFEASASSFLEVLRRQSPGSAPEPVGEVSERLRGQLVEGTTVLALIAEGAVVVVGDRRATAGNQISRGDMRKVFPADAHSAVAISGAAGPAMEMAKLFATELEHYEKVEGESLSLEGKSTKLAAMVRAHLPMALQGFVVVPLFAGVEPRGSRRAVIYEYDPIGGRYVGTEYAATGSGSMAARATLKRLADPTAEVHDAVRATMEALIDASEEDSATGGPDLIRRVYPIVAVVDADGYRELSDEDVAGHVEAVLDGRRR